jgi:signal transduction histidine kinase
MAALHVMTAVDAATGLVLLAAGLMSIRRAPGCLLLAAGLAWFAGDAASWAVYLHRGPLVQLVAVYPFLRPRGTWAWVLTAAGYLCAVLAVLTASSPAAFALAAALVLSAGYRFAVATGPQRRARASALGAASALACALSVGPALQLAGLGDSGFAVPYDLLIMVIAAGVAVDLRWGRWSRATVSGLVVELAQPGPLRARLARALGDPGLTVGLWVAARGGYVDESGREVTVPPASSQLGQTVTFLDVDGQPAGVLIHDPPAPADQVLVAEVASAARLAMANAGLREGVRARSVEVAASRRRLVETGDAVRRALAEDLGQGPGRHLVRAAEFLGGADGEVPGALLAGVDRAQAVLRDLVTGIHPAALTAGGLSDALPGLAELCPVPVSLDVPPRRFPAGVEAAVYFVCSEALANIARHAGATTAALRVWERDGRLYLEISDDGVGAAVIGDGIQAGGSGLRGLADRMAALGGSLAVDSPPGAGTRVTAELPLAGAPVLGP